MLTDRIDLSKDFPDAMIDQIPEDSPCSLLIVVVISGHIDQASLIIVDPIDLRGRTDQCPRSDRERTQKDPKETDEEKKIFHLSQSNKPIETRREPIDLYRLEDHHQFWSQLFKCRKEMQRSNKPKNQIQTEKNSTHREREILFSLSLK